MIPGPLCECVLRELRVEREDLREREMISDPESFKKGRNFYFSSTLIPNISHYSSRNLKKIGPIESTL